VEFFANPLAIDYAGGLLKLCFIQFANAPIYLVADC
jgi:hypothetical protein